MTQIYLADIDELKKSYLLLKREAYYEHVDLFLRAAIAEFEKCDVDDELEAMRSFLNSQELEHPWFKKQLDTIGVYFLPKKIKPALNKNQKSFISNLRTQDEYQIEEVNYFISGSISIYILSMLWSIVVGPYIDKQLSDDCLGNRLDIDVDNNKIKSEYRLFKLYINQYNQWRDKAIQTGLDLLENKADVLLIALDFKQCFYKLPVKWDPVLKFIRENIPLDNTDYSIFLTKVLEKIHIAYYNKTEKYLEKTHKLDVDSTIPIGIPVGLPSSRILANWELKEFDQVIKDNLRPIYYGRYVDDMLIVINNPKKELMENKGNIADILNEYLLNTKILHDENPETQENNNNKDKLYRANDYPHLFIQNNKIILHYYDHMHSWAGLKEFKEELKQKASEFRFLPSEDQYKDLVDEAYDIQYDGSIYKFRSVIGINENATKLSHFLYKQQLKNWLANDSLRNKTIDEIFRFYQGKNIFDYCRLWEKIFTLFIVSQRYRDFYKFNRELEKTIQKLTFTTEGEEVAKKLKEDCIFYKKIAMSIAIGYMGEIILKDKTSHQFYAFLKEEFGDENNSTTEEFRISKNKLPSLMRSSLLLRHQNMFWPLLDYTNYSGNLTRFDWSSFTNRLDFNNEKFKIRSRFVQLDEVLLLKYLKNVLSLDQESTIESNMFYHFNEFIDEDQTEFLSNPDPTFDYIQKISAKNIFIQWKSEENLKIYTKIKSNDTHPKNLSVGIVNLKVNEQDIEACYNPKKKPTNRYKRQLDLFDLINLGIREPKCDLIVFPEVSIPFAWLPFMVNQARRNNLGFIFGVEHIIRNPYALNLVATILPYKDENQFTNVYLSLRLKNYYSPKEEHELGLFNLHRPNYLPVYEKYSWNGTVFSTYNCFELTDINHRGLFRSELDLMIAVEYNQDINYFSNIIEAATRDIHCYAIQANSSNYGDSRVISPQVTEKMNIIRVKGGDNSLLLKTTLDIEALRDFQSREYSPDHKEYKPTPAGYDHNMARNRQ